jgi:hypothetical protein
VDTAVEKAREALATDRRDGEFLVVVATRG